jgi:sterol desaturase/sphingolipid hydroxylase (fatty acid hydroxylase superfamily)
MTSPAAVLIAVTAIFLAWERIWPGRELPRSAGWYLRSLSINCVQLSITLLTGTLWFDLLGGTAVFDLADLGSPVLQGLLGWFVGTFVFYWWHRLRHRRGWWTIFHQIHHSPSRIEILTSFYKHPIEIFANSFLMAAVLFPFLGCSLAGSFWCNVFAATGEYFYHANVKTPGWLRYFIQTPELHAVHHQYDVHKYNYSDLPIWDRIFGTYRDMTTFTSRCGFPGENERRFWQMLAFKDVYDA